MSSSRLRNSIAFAAGMIAALASGDPAWAQIDPAPDLSGSWSRVHHEDWVDRSPGPMPGDFTGLALNEEGRALALSSSVSRNSTFDRQCSLYGPQYLVIGPFGIKVWPQLDPISGKTLAYHIGAWEDRTETIIWLDGRPHPSANAMHTRAGFETGEWHGNTLTTRTTHIKEGIIRRNEARVSSQTTLLTHYIRNDNLLTVMMFIYDPVYLSAPHVVSKDFRLSTTDTLSANGPVCIPIDEGADSDVVYHYLPGTNPLLGELQRAYGIPREAALGGEETMYPEYRKKLKDGYVRPEKCLINCSSPGTPRPSGNSGTTGPGAIGDDSNKREPK